MTFCECGREEEEINLQFTIFPPRADPSPEANPPLVEPRVEPPADILQFCIHEVAFSNFVNTRGNYLTLVGNHYRI